MKITEAQKKKLNAMIIKCYNHAIDLREKEKIMHDYIQEIYGFSYAAMDCEQIIDTVSATSGYPGEHIFEELERTYNQIKQGRIKNLTD